MKDIVFFDLETRREDEEIVDIGCIKNDDSYFHKNSTDEFFLFIDAAEYLCGHNIISHDLRILNKKYREKLRKYKIIDTLLLAPILFPAKPYHKLVKDDKLQSDDINNPRNDSLKAKDLFNDEISAFNSLDEDLKNIYFVLLSGDHSYRSFFDYLSFVPSSNTGVLGLINSIFRSSICSNANLGKLVTENPVELAYCLALINCANEYSITPPWVLKTFPQVDKIMYLLRSNPCLEECAYCNKSLDPHLALQQFFGFSSFREFDDKPLQYEAVNAAIRNKSILVVFPTGGGKSLTFQLPALISGRNNKGLTVIISPLQSLMKDQVDNLEKKGITSAVTINGLLDPIEKAKSIERVADGSACILYISPESLRSKTIERLLGERRIDRFVIDEAHCFSSWGQDFRVDYLYIGVFIKNLLELKNSTDRMPVSCFTATAKPQVIEDIKAYFRDKLSLELELFTSASRRTNLSYCVKPSKAEEEKYNTLRNLLEEKDSPTIIYVSRTSKTVNLAKRLNSDGFNALPFHGKMDPKDKTANQNSFMSGESRIMVATSAFGMGVDKSDVGMVIHYDISDSLENYVQEAGRAGRDEKINADCYILYNEEDLGKHFILLNQTKLDISEIKQVWRAVKEITKTRRKISNSALEIARKAGWNDSIKDIEGRIAAAISALEEAKYVKRSHNEPRIFASSILPRTSQDAIDKINSSERFDDREKQTAIRVVKQLISAKSRKATSDEVAETRVDYISDNLGIEKKTLFRIINLLKDEGILGDMKDLTAFITSGDSAKDSIKITHTFSEIESGLLNLIEDNEGTYNIKEINEILGCTCKSSNTDRIKRILNLWSIKNWIKKQTKDTSRNHVIVQPIQPLSRLKEKISKRHGLAKFIIEYLYGKVKINLSPGTGEKPVEFSVHELRDEYMRSQQLFKEKITDDDVEDTLFYLSRIEALRIEGGFMVIYNRMTIERLEDRLKVQYKQEDYRKLEDFYRNKVQQIHIVGEYARKMIEDYNGAMNFVDDYFNLNYDVFLNRYFPGSRKDEITKKITPAKFGELFGSLNESQLEVIKDSNSKYILVAAGPGSGKTKLLVHKLASLLLMENCKHEHLLMLTFSRAAATEFRKRLIELYGNAANFIEIKTFHSFCFDLLGKVGTISKSDEIIKSAIQKIKDGEIEQNKITKTVLVIDEAQDMDQAQAELIRVLVERNETIRVIAVGDEDQNIYSFRGSDSKFMSRLVSGAEPKIYELVKNYRSRRNTVTFTNRIVSAIPGRLKKFEIDPYSNEDGRIDIFEYRSGNIIVPLVNRLIGTELKGSTCVMTYENQEAMQVTGLLNKQGLRAKLIQEDDSFNLYNLKEVRFLTDFLCNTEIPVIAAEKWEEAKRRIREDYSNSPFLDMCMNLMKEFESSNTKTRYYSDFTTFVYESALEDFIGESGGTVFVSTMHKSKGREFNNVIIMLPDYDISDDERKRLLYVAMTRARENLTIHYKGNFLRNINVRDLSYNQDHNEYDPPEILLMNLNHKQVNLGYYKFVQNRIHRLTAGQNLEVDAEGCMDLNGNRVLRFSNQFLSEIAGHDEKGYVISGAKVNFLVYWSDKEDGKEYLIVLPEVTFIRKNIR